jgi:hypothetical protein
MRSLEVVDHPSLVEMVLTVLKISKGFGANNFRPQGTVKAFVLSQGFWMTGSGMADRYPQTNQPGRKFGIAIVISSSPGLTVIAQDAVGQSVSAEKSDQVRLNRLHGFLSTGKKPQRIPRIIVHNSQGMAADMVLQKKVFLKVHLPQKIGHGCLKPLPGRMLGRFRRINIPPWRCKIAVIVPGLGSA